MNRLTTTGSRPQLDPRRISEVRPGSTRGRWDRPSHSSRRPGILTRGLVTGVLEPLRRTPSHPSRLPEHLRNALIPIVASLASTTPAHPAVSSLEASPTPAH